ncbi:MAG: ATP synthase F1 subunit delta [Actinomycetaceae bacterium]|nr:ATP synthase F1 subunit delta [Arcanobacterium sp.]MDD7504972.1 ATP synthase F1 subunit delta [Actinomycetaceae bacterium]MDY6143371.1 ATP synthase F1 subunit delta [Arcanobacterium sp.]
MRRGSEDALARARDNWDAALRQSPGGELDYARELFALRDSLGLAPALSAALEDHTREDADRVDLARDVFSGKVSDLVVDLLSGLVRENWSEDGDLFDAIESLAVESVLAGAQREGILATVEEELYMVRGMLSQQRELRLALSDKYRTVAERQQLGERVFHTLSGYTQQLLTRGIERTHVRPLNTSLSYYLAASEQRADHLIASVTAAVPFTREQEERLIAILERKYDAKVKVHITLDPSIVGGARVHIGNDVIDGTLRGRISAVKEAFTK